LLRGCDVISAEGGWLPFGLHTDDAGQPARSYRSTVSRLTDFAAQECF
jgi:hypothetical protein